MPQFNIDDIEKRTLNSLKDFQRATVDRVDFLFRNGQNRVLVADEVGMGKTLIARGTIVKTARLALLLSRLTTDDMLSKRISLGTPPVALNDAIRQSNTSCLVLYSY